MRRLLSLLWIVWCAPEARAALPCAADDTPPALSDLAARLLKSRTPAAWTALQAEAEALADPTLQPVPTARACALYLAGGAAFFRSAAPGPERTVRAVEAVNHLLRAAVLDPAAFTERQPKARLGAAFKRLAAAPDQAPPTTPLVSVRLPVPPVGSAPTEGWLRLSAPAVGLAVDLPAPPPGAPPAILWLRPGTWTVTWRAPCGEVSHAQTLGDTIQLPPAPACPLILSVRGADEAPLPDAQVHTAAGVLVTGPLSAALGMVHISAPGHLAWQGTPPTAGGPWILRLEPLAPAPTPIPEPPVAEVVRAEVPPVETPPPIQPARRERPLAPVLTLGLGGLSAAAGLLAGIGALNTQSALDNYTTRREEGVAVDTLARRRDNQAFTADVLLGTGAVLLVGGLVWYLLTDEK